MTERQEEMIYYEGFHRGFENGYEACRDELAEKMMERIEEDGTLVVGVKDATAVTRVLVEDGQKNGDLYYADRPKGKWRDTGKDKEHLHPLSARWYRCSVCGLETNAKTNYCCDCGANMRQTEK